MLCNVIPLLERAFVPVRLDPSVSSGRSLTGNFRIFWGLSCEMRVSSISDCLDRLRLGVLTCNYFTKWNMLVTRSCCLGLMCLGFIWTKRTSVPVIKRGSTQREAVATQRKKNIPHVTLINNFFFSKGKIKSSICFGKLLI